MNVFLGAHNILSPLAFSSFENFELILKGHSAVKAHSFPFSESPVFCSLLDKKLLDKTFSPIGDSERYTRLEKMCILSIQDVLNQSKTSLSAKDTLLILSTTKGNIDIPENRYLQ